MFVKPVDVEDAIDLQELSVFARAEIRDIIIAQQNNQIKRP